MADRYPPRLKSGAGFAGNAVSLSPNLPFAVLLLKGAHPAGGCAGRPLPDEITIAIYNDCPRLRLQR